MHINEVNWDYGLQYLSLSFNLSLLIDMYELHSCFQSALYAVLYTRRSFNKVQ